jgi:NADH-quinone oxidoreductase subunit J
MNLTWLSGNNLAFYVLALVGLGTAVLTVTVRNMVHAALSLAATLLCVAGLYLTLQADLIAGVQALIYVGAIITLLLVAIMLIHGIADRRISQTNRNWPFGLAVAGGLAALLLAVVVNPANWNVGPPQSGTERAVRTEAFHPVPGATEGRTLEPSLQRQLNELGKVLLSRYLLPFEVASLLLLVALVGAIVLAQEVRKGPHHEP